MVEVRRRLLLGGGVTAEEDPARNSLRLVSISVETEVLAADAETMLVEAEGLVDVEAERREGSGGVAVEGVLGVNQKSLVASR